MIPPPGKFAGMLKWLIPLMICAMFVAGFFMGGAKASASMAFWWVAANGILV